MNCLREGALEGDELTIELREDALEGDELTVELREGALKGDELTVELREGALEGDELTVELREGALEADLQLLVGAVVDDESRPDGDHLLGAALDAHVEDDARRRHLLVLQVPAPLRQIQVPTSAGTTHTQVPTPLRHDKYSLTPARHVQVPTLLRLPTSAGTTHTQIPAPVRHTQVPTRTGKTHAGTYTGNTCTGTHHIGDT